MSLFRLILAFYRCFSDNFPQWNIKFINLFNLIIHIILKLYNFGINSWSILSLQLHLFMLQLNNLLMKKGIHLNWLIPKLIDFILYLMLVDIPLINLNFLIKELNISLNSLLLLLLVQISIICIRILFYRWWISLLYSWWSCT